MPEQGPMVPKPKHSKAVNTLALIGAMLYLLFQCGGPFLKVTPVDLTLKNMAFSLMTLIQIVRGLAWQLKWPIPDWLLLKKMDRRFGADSTVVFICLFVILELTCRAHLDPSTEVMDPHIAYPLIAVELVLGLWLCCLTMPKGSAITVGGSALAGTVLLIVAMMVFCLPIFCAAGVAYGTYRFFDLHGQREIESLAAAAIVPFLAAAVVLALKDKRDRLKNTTGVIVTQFVALPAIPLVYLLIKSFWPANISPMLFPVAIMIIIALPRLLARRTSPWLVKERVMTLEAQFTLDKELARSPGTEIEAELADIAYSLKESRLKLKCAADQVDRADALWKLGDLNVILARYDMAETNYQEAIIVYNKAMEMEPENRLARANKFKTVDALSYVQRLKMGPLDS